MAKKYNIPKKWNEQERQAFIDLYESMMESPDLYTHPATDRSADWDDLDWVMWKTTAWNAAWMSAEFLRYNRKFNG